MTREEMFAYAERQMSRAEENGYVSEYIMPNIHTPFTYRELQLIYFLIHHRWWSFTDFREAKIYRETLAKYGIHAYEY